MALEAVAVAAVLAALGWVAAIDAPTASVIVAIVTAAGAVAIKWVPKTRAEAARDRATARLEDAQAWDQLVENLRESNQELRTEIATLKAEKIAAEAKNLQLEETANQLRADFAALKRLLQSGD